MAQVPFENISLHYSQHHSVSIDPEALFRKIVQGRRGGYCMENNGFFGIVLRSLGFSLYAVGGRVCDRRHMLVGDRYTGWSEPPAVLQTVHGVDSTD